MMQIYVGVDPGVSGALAAVDMDRGLLLLKDAPTRKVPHGHEYELAAMADILRAVKAAADGGDVFVVVERSIPYGRNSSASVAKAARSVALWEGMAVAFDCSVDTVAPANWKKAMDLSKSKQDSLDRARQLYPESCGFIYQANHDGRAEAILLAEYLRRNAIGS